jgi:hypothetical protein
MPTVGQCATDPVSGVAGDIWNAWTNNGAGGSSGLAAEALASGNTYRAQISKHLEGIAGAIIAASGGGLTVKDEGSSLGTKTTFNFLGSATPTRSTSPSRRAARARRSQTPRLRRSPHPATSA